MRGAESGWGQEGAGGRALRFEGVDKGPGGRWKTEQLLVVGLACSKEEQ